MDAKNKKSYGIAICKMGKDGSELFMCRKRVTYEFNEFVYGKYDGREKLSQLINGMTHQEKMAILTFNFDRLWYQLTLSNVSHSPRSFSHQCKKKFEETFVDDMKEYLMDIISVSRNGYKVWEIPKGRPDNWEKPLDTAIREVAEEANITPAQYTLSFNKRYVFKTIDYGVTYHMYYFMAKLNDCSQITYKSAEWHHEEIDQVKWWSVAEIEKMCKHTSQFTRTYFEFAKMILGDFIGHDDIEELPQASYEEHTDTNQDYPQF